MTDLRLTAAIATAKTRNGWTVVEIGQVREGGHGWLPSGVVRFKRDRAPLGEDRAYATAEWVEREDGTIAFQAGRYDLTEADSIDNYQRRRFRNG